MGEPAVSMRRPRLPSRAPRRARAWQVRRGWRVAAPMALVLSSGVPAPHAAPVAGSTAARPSPWIDCYAYPPSVAQGDSIGIYVSTDAPAFDLRIRRDSPHSGIRLSAGAIPGREQPVRPAPWENGCGWGASYTVAIPPDWPSGVYLCDLSVGTQVLGHALFTVREDQPGSTSAILFQNSISTWQAYNGWGGKSLYEFNSTDSLRAHAVSFERPYGQSLGLGDYTYAERPFVHWLDAQGIPVEFCTDLDTHADPRLLDEYTLLLVVGHDEYWSLEQRDHVETFVARGGNVGIFGGNTCWWQVRISPRLDRIICYKDKMLDPLHGVDDARVTVQWAAEPVSRPENHLTGVSWRNGGFVNAFGWFPASAGYGGYQAYHTDHWVFAGTGLENGDVFGRAATIVGYETDGALMAWSSGLPFATGVDETPVSYRILGLSPASWGHATMGIHTSGGMVFNAATIDWAHGLASDPVVATITRNVLARLSPRVAVEPPGPPGPALLWVEPVPGRDQVRLAWMGDVGAPAHLAVYTVDGRQVARTPVAAGPGGGSWVWNREDQRGGRVASGIYWARLTGSCASATARVCIMD